MLIFGTVQAPRAADQVSSGDTDMINQTAITFVLISAIPSSGSSATPSKGNTDNPTILPGSTNKNTINLSGAWRQNMSLNFSYRDQTTRKYGCDFTLFLSYTGSSGPVDNHYGNFNAYQIIGPNREHVNCTAETGFSFAEDNQGAKYAGVNFIKNP